MKPTYAYYTSVRHSTVKQEFELLQFKIKAHIIPKHCMLHGKISNRFRLYLIYVMHVSTCICTINMSLHYIYSTHFNFNKRENVTET